VVFEEDVELAALLISMIKSVTVEKKFGALY